MIVFDMDGVLVEVTESYRESIRQTVRHFTGREISYELIQQYKNSGGWNNDWALSQKIAADLGVDASYETVIEEFQKIFLGANGSRGLILREKWIAQPGALERLAGNFELAIYTGRPRDEAQLTLDRFASRLTFAPIVTADDVARGKPHPEGLEKIRAMRPAQQLWYIGDTVDDARCARAAGVPFIGVASQAANRRGELLDLFASENAATVLEDINSLETFFANR
jgi:HAD superfamily hydrolase (TIGR01548 family)